MSEQEVQLIRCFSAVFPQLPPDKIRLARAESLESWDSLASVTLVGVVQEVFGVEIGLLEMPELNSFDAFRTYLDRRGTADGAR